MREKRRSPASPVDVTNHVPARVAISREIPPKLPEVKRMFQAIGVMSSSSRRSSVISRKILMMIAGLLRVETPRVRGK